MQHNHDERNGEIPASAHKTCLRWKHIGSQAKPCIAYFGLKKWASQVMDNRLSTWPISCSLMSAAQVAHTWLQACKPKASKL